MRETAAELVTVRYSGTELGRMERLETARRIFCRLGSVGQSEFFAAYNSGFKPEFKVLTHPANYGGERIIDVELPGEILRCDIYRTYQKSEEVLELWVVRKNPTAEQVFTLWTGGKRVTLVGAYLTGSDGAQRTETGKVATDTVSLILPQSLQAWVGETTVGYCRPKAYAAMTVEEQAAHWTIDSGSFFAAGDIRAEGKYQEINAAFDDVYRVQSVARKSGSGPDAEYLEVVGK